MEGRRDKSFDAGLWTGHGGLGSHFLRAAVLGLFVDSGCGMLRVATAAALLFGVALVTVLQFAVASLLIKALWNWFIVPVSGAHSIDFFESMGLYIVIGVLIQFVTILGPRNDNIAGDTFNQQMLFTLRHSAKVAVLGPLISLFAAWVWHTFFM